MRRPFPLAFSLAVVAFSCGQGASCGGMGGGCSLQPIPGGRFTGTRSDSAAAARLTDTGFSVVNANSQLILDSFAPGGILEIPLSCTVQSASVLGQVTIGDEGGLYCNSEACGQLDGKCDAKDEPRVITATIDSLSLAPKGPDLLEATIDVTIATGKIMISSVSRSHLACLLIGGGAIKCGVDLDTARAAPTSNVLKAGIRFTVDQRWDRLLSFEVAQLDGTQVCGSSGAQPPPACIDGADIVISTEGACSICGLANFSIVKTLLLDQITKTLQKKLEDTLAKANCRKCEDSSACPTNAVAASVCRFDLDGGSADAGTCEDLTTGRCVPAIVGVEGRLPVGTLLGAVGAPANAAIDLSIAAGGGATASAAGFTMGFMGGAVEPMTAACVKPLTEPTFPALPLPNFDADAPGVYDVGVSLSQQLLTRALFHAQQSGALCLELGTEDVAILDSSLVATLLPSLDKLTHGEAVPTRVVIRPVNPPTASIGKGTVAAGMPQEPLILLNWSGVEIDLYAMLEDRQARLFTLSADLKLPLSLSVDGCSQVTPVLGDLKNAVTNVHAKNSEMLAEELTAVEALVPALLALAEPSLAKGLSSFTVPSFGNFQVQLLAAKGVGAISGTAAFNHLGLYAQLTPLTQPCTPQMSHALKAQARHFQHGSGAAELDVGLDGLAAAEYSYRVGGGLWSTWRLAPGGVLLVDHPRLRLNAEHLVEVRARDEAGHLSNIATVPLPVKSK